MNIFFANNSRSLSNLKVEEVSSNPGIGGTEFILIKLVIKLSIIDKLNKYYILSDKKIFINNQIMNSNVHLAKSDFIFNINNDIVVCPVSQLEFLEKIRNLPKRIIFWSHHPHDIFNPKNIKNFDVVSIGSYQYISNYLIHGKHFRIDNLSPSYKYNNDKKENKFVYIGGFAKGKGLHLILKSWPKIVALLPDAELNIIGGDLYHELNLSTSLSDFPIRGKYASLLLKIVSKYPTELQGSIHFKGLLTSTEADKILSNSKIALLNPTGYTEAAPASPLDCFKFGIPVIAGGDYGMLDIMSEFPELDLKKYSITKIINNIKSEKKLTELINHSIKYSIIKESFNKSILSDWIFLFNNNLETYECPKISLYLKIKIFYRSKLTRPLIYLFKKIRFNNKNE
jgi:glycosyltransferase involved in cell wall biosynthesis